VSVPTTEDLDAFRARSRRWIRENLRQLGPGEATGHQISILGEEGELAAVAHDRLIQHRLFDAGLAGICVPVEYGGRGLSEAHKLVLNEELAGYEYPTRVQVPTFSPCLGVLLEFGTEEQKRSHIPAMLKGEELWMQFLSEPSGGSDVAGALTNAVRDGDVWVLNGSKVWTTGAWWSDWALCVARTNWDVPKHRGLTVFMLPIHQPGIDVHRIEMLNGSKEFCQEFLSDVVVPDSDRIGEVDDGWTVVTRWMYHERMLYRSPFVTEPLGSAHGGLTASSVAAVARSASRAEDPRVQELIGEARMLDLVRDELAPRIVDGITSGHIPDPAAAIVRLFTAMVALRISTLRFEVAGAAGGAWTEDDGPATDSGGGFLMRQVACLGGGTTEMARNVISERVLGMPREQTLDRDVPFRDVPRSRTRGT
jgi:alkylation response protein AidB-like acyl-CoA dehydrogenase